MSDTPRHPLHDVVAEYVLELMDTTERVAFEARLGTDRELAESVLAAREDLTALAFSTPVAVPASLKARVMAHAVAPTASALDEAKVLPMTTPIRRSRAPLWLGAALAAALAVIAKQAVDLNRVRATSAEAQAAAHLASRVVLQRDSIITRLTSPDVELVTLASTGAAKPSIKAYVDSKRGKLVLAVTSLEAVPEGKSYQLWFIATGKAPMPSVTFQTDSAGRALLTDVALPGSDWSIAAITVEPTGGSSAPTTAPILAGQRNTR